MKKTVELFNNANKKLIEIEFLSRKLPQIKIWEFWRYHEGINIWQEISKDWNQFRPCFIISEIENISLILILPLTTKFNTKFSQYL